MQYGMLLTGGLYVTIPRMPFVKGAPKPAGSGRKKGQECVKRVPVHAGHTPLTAKVADKLAALGCDPVALLVQFATGKYKAELRFSAAKELASYVYPKLKAIEHTGPGGGPIEHDTGLQALKDRIHSLAASFGST